MTIFQSVHFIIICSLLGVILAIVYARNPRKNQHYYELTKATWSVMGAVLLMINVISGNDKLELTIALATVVLGILEGLAILLKPFIAKKE